jgi:hypothetical protein
MVRAEHTLFARRAALTAPPLPTLVFTDRGVEAGPRRAARVVSSIARLVRRGHVSVACAAALFFVAAFSRLGSESQSVVTSSKQISADPEAPTSGVLASMRTEEALACSLTPARATLADEVDISSSSVSSALASLSTFDRGLVCGSDRAEGASSCGASVTCAPLRQ